MEEIAELHFWQYEFLHFLNAISQEEKHRYFLRRERYREN